MTSDEFLSLMKSRGANIFPPERLVDFNTINTKLQQMHIAILPKFLQDLYTKCSGITMGSGYVFGPVEIDRKIKYPMPSIIKFNQDVCNYKNLSNKTIFGYNDLFWFAFDAFGNCYMLDNITLSILRKYDDPYRAMVDCLIIGKI